jgi:hypothetical protein
MTFSMRTALTRILRPAAMIAVCGLAAWAQQPTEQPTQQPTEQPAQQPEEQVAAQSANQTPASPEASVTPQPAATSDGLPPGGNRVMGVLPNYRTASAADEGTPISAKHKIYIASKDSFDYPLVGIAAVFAGFGQLGNQNPSFGQGLKGYARRWGLGYVDQAVGNMFAEGLFPAMLHEDPRYFRRGSGSTGHRVVYALSRVMITDTDSGKKRFNYSEWLGNASAVAISNTYYPDGRNVEDNVIKLLTQVGTDAASQVLKEFWPDLKKKFKHKN